MHYCEKCGRMKDDKEFYTSKNIEKYPPDGKLHTCKQCTTMHVDNWDPETYKWILEEVDVPYVKEEWDSILAKYGSDPEKITGMTIIGRYLSKMKLKQWNKYSWADTEKLADDARESKIVQMKAQGLSSEEINAQLSIERTPAKPQTLFQSDTVQPLVEEYEEEEELTKYLTEEDKMRLRIKWGRNYRPDEWVRMEKLYNEMMQSYDIQGAGHKDTLIMICKTSLKANELIDAGDVDGFQKMQKAYDSLMKSGRFTAAQIKEQDNEDIDSIGELVAICEKEGFIPRYYVTGPKDHVDRTLQDMQKYTRTLVTEELNLGNMIESAVREIELDKAKEAIIEVDDAETDEDQRFEDSLFADEEVKELTNEDYKNFESFKDSLREQDEEEERRVNDHGSRRSSKSRH